MGSAGRIAALAAILAVAGLSAAPAEAGTLRKEGPLTVEERATVLDWLDAYSEEEIEIVIGHLEGTMFITTTKNINPDATDRDRDRKLVIRELRYELVKPCPESRGRYLNRCSVLHGDEASYARRFHQKYYGDCTERVVSDCWKRE